MIGLEVTVIMDGYWKDFPSEVVRERILADWMDELQDWHVDQVRAALKQWRNENPSKKPNPGHILGILKARRGKTWVNGPKKDPIFAIDRPVFAEIGQDRKAIA